MKPIQKRLAVISLSALLVTGAGAALAFGGHHDRFGGCDRDGERTPMAQLQRLDDITPEQRDQLQEIRKQARDEFRKLRDAMRDNHSDLRDAMADDSDLETIRGLAQKQGEQVMRMIVLRAEIRQKINGVLTDAQRQQLSELRLPGEGYGQPSNRMGF